MNSHIAITALKNGRQQPLNLGDDFSIDIDDQNPLFNDNEMFSYPCRMPMEGNRFLLGNIDDPANIDRPVALEHTKMRIVVDNQPFRSGTLVTAEDEEIDTALTMNITASEHSIDDLIGELQCRDVPLKDRIVVRNLMKLIPSLHSVLVMRSFRPRLSVSLILAVVSLSQAPRRKR